MDIPLTSWTFTVDTLLIGCLTGLAYAILAAGIVLIFRATKVINFAHGEIGAFGAALLALMVLDWKWSYWVALPAVLVVGGVLGAVIDLAVVRRLFKAPRLILLVATIGVSQVAFLFRVLLPEFKNPGPYPTPLNSEIVVGDLLLHSQHFMVIAFVPAVIAGLSLFLTRTPFGVAIRASASNSDRAQLAGIPIKRVSTAVWSLSGVLAVLTVVLLNPLRTNIVGLPDAALGPSLLLRALAAALVGGLISLPRAFAGGIAIGLAEAIVFANASAAGIVDALLFCLVFVLIIRRGSLDDGRGGSWSLTPKVKAIPLTLTRVWWVRHLNRLVGGVGLSIAVVLPFLFDSAAQTFLFTRVLIFAMIGLSTTVLIGWAGQLSLGQFAFVGVGALSATSLVGAGMGFEVACAYAAVAGGFGALLVGFPALRVQGPLLALTTLAFAVACQGWFFRQGIFGTDSIFQLPRSTVFGFLDLRSERTYYFVVLVVLTLTVLGVSRLRSSGIGRTIIAVRENESAAASFTVSPTVAKLSAFTFSGALAGLSGALLAGAMGQYQLVNPDGPAPFGPEASLQAVAMVVIGGLGSVGGAIIGAVYTIGLPALFGNSLAIGVATSGIGLLLLLLYLPGGLMQLVYTSRDALLARAERQLSPAERSATGGAAVAALPVTRRRSRMSDEERAAVPALLAEDVSVAFGGTQALRGVSVRVEPGEVVGLIGSNGAGKSTLMNVISGFVTPTSGRVHIAGTDATALPPHARAGLGVGRVFQDARLFGDLTLRETVKVALEAHERSEFVPSLLSLPPSRRAERVKTAEADAYIDFLGLGRYADHFLSDLSTGTRRIVEMCCLLAQGSQLLLLDEPTAGVAQRETEAFGPLIKRIQHELAATIVIIEHDIPLVVSISDRMYCFAAGEQIAEGRPDDVRNDPAVIAAYLGTDERAIARSGAVPEQSREVLPRSGGPSATSNGHAQDLAPERLHSLTRASLLAEAAELQVEGRSRLSKRELITAILEKR